MRGLDPSIPNREPTKYYATAIARNKSQQTEAIIPAAPNSAPAPNMDATAQAKSLAARPTTTLTPIPTATSTPTPIEITLADLLHEYEQNKVLADIHYRYRQNGKAPIKTEAYIDEVSDLYFTMLPRDDSSWQEEIDCYYADTRTALHIQKGQRVKITARVIGKSSSHNQALDMFHCEIDGLEFDNSPTISTNGLRANTVQVICITAQSRSEKSGHAGTGVIIDAENGIILTVHHVIVNEAQRKNCENLYVKVQGRQDHIPATIVKHCASIDRARIRVSPNALSSMTLQPIYRAAAPAQVDQEIYFWGYGGGEGVLRMEKGLVQSISWDDVIADTYAIPGDSGAPVYNEYGHLLGTMSRSNASDRAVFTGDLCGEEATPTRVPTASASSATSANSTPTVERTATPAHEITAMVTPAPPTFIGTPTATHTPTSTPTPIPHTVVVQVAQSASTGTPIPTVTPTPIQVGSSRDNPIPLGESGTTYDDFMVSVVEAQKNAHDIVVQANENKHYYEEPRTGHVYIMVRIKVQNLSSEPQKFDKWYRLCVVGPSQLEFPQCHTPAGIAYFPYEVPEEYDDDRLMFQDGELEGNLCFTVKSSDLNSLVMFVKGESNWLYFALQ